MRSLVCVLDEGVEVVDVEANWERHHRNDLITRYGCSYT